MTTSWLITRKPSTTRLRTVPLAILGLMMRAEVAWACPVCFTATDSPVVSGVSMAILTLLGVTLGVLASFGWFFINLMRRGRAAAGETRVGQPVEQGGHS